MYIYQYVGNIILIYSIYTQTHAYTTPTFKTLNKHTYTYTTRTNTNYHTDTHIQESSLIKEHSPMTLLPSLHPPHTITTTQLLSYTHIDQDFS